MYSGTCGLREFGGKGQKGGPSASIRRHQFSASRVHTVTRLQSEFFLLMNSYLSCNEASLASGELSKPLTSQDVRPMFEVCVLPSSLQRIKPWQMLRIRDIEGVNLSSTSTYLVSSKCEVLPCSCRLSVWVNHSTEIIRCTMTITLNTAHKYKVR